MRDEEDEEEEDEEGVRPKETLGLSHLDMTALVISTTRFLDACGAAFMLIFTISVIVYGAFYLAL